MTKMTKMIKKMATTMILVCD